MATGGRKVVSSISMRLLGIKKGFSVVPPDWICTNALNTRGQNNFEETQVTKNMHLSGPTRLDLDECIVE